MPDAFQQHRRCFGDPDCGTIAPPVAWSRARRTSVREPGRRALRARIEYSERRIGRGCERWLDDAAAASADPGADRRAARNEAQRARPCRVAGALGGFLLACI